ncbi:MAG: cytochrome c3 family protein [Verrucomicrobia bacterium]|nr:cytochrome c3 family protein [Verrucomicrobiota bacterium]
MNLPAISFPNRRRGVSAVLALFVAAGVAAVNAEPLPNSHCWDCHEDDTLTKTDAQGREISVFVDAGLLSNSVHRAVLCVNCHADITDKHPDDDVPAKPATCVGCHESQANHEQAQREYLRSIHGSSHTQGAAAAATCASCHGSHAILSSRHPGSPVFKLNLARTCAQCHTNPALAAKFHIKYPEVAAQYQDSIHGRKLAQGLIVAPSCSDCHGVHDIARATIPTSPIAPENVAKTCGQCHFGVEQTYAASVHGQLAAQGHADAPVCTTCHSAHEIELPASGHFKATSDQKCGQCHEDRLVHYRDTYHGKAMALGRPNVAPDVAACYDCHGHHDVYPPSDPRSRLSSTNILATCQKCHPDATAGFTQYKPHANPLDRANYPLLHAVFVGMTALVVGVFAFFGLHTLAWLVRAIYLYLNDSKTFREAKIEIQEDDEWFSRFAPFDRFLHFLVVTSFLLLVITGMPLKFYYTNWAKVMFDVIGGPDTARVLHRFGAIVTFLYFGLHLIALAGKAWRGRKAVRDPVTGRFQMRRLWGVLFGPDSMVPTLQDWRDFVAHNKWFFGKGPKPQFDRWTYWEKFDYFAVFWGVFIIGASGLIMWFPAWFTQFLPGWIINVALIVHSDEALLAAGFIFSIHFFNTHFRIEKFPMDTVIFSGRVSKAELLHERKRWHDRLVAEGRLDQHRVKDEWERWKSIARTFGYLFFGLGVFLLVLIIYAMVRRLTHGGV